MKNTPKGNNSSLHDTEEHISDLKDWMMEITQSEQQKEKQILKNKNSLRNLYDNIKHTNIHIIGSHEKRGKGRKCISWNYAANFPNLKKGTDIQVQEAQRIWNMMNPKRSTSRYISYIKC